MFKIFIFKKIRNFLQNNNVFNYYSNLIKIFSIKIIHLLKIVLKESLNKISKINKFHNLSYKMIFRKIMIFKINNKVNKV